MEFSDLVRKRRSTHNFKPGFSLSDEAFFEILEDVRFTPSGYNAQPWDFILIRDESKLEAICDISFGQKHILTSGNLVILVGNTEFGKEEKDRIVQEWSALMTKDQLEAMEKSLIKDRPLGQKREMVLRNAALAAMTFLYSAENQGYQTCPMMGFSQGKLAKILELPENVIPVLMIALGQSDPSTPETDRLQRRSAQSIGHIEKYKN